MENLEQPRINNGKKMYENKNNQGLFHSFFGRDSRSMGDSMDRESTKGADDSDRKPFSKLDDLEEERVDPLDCLEENTSMIDSKDKRTQGEQMIQTNTLCLAGQDWGGRGE